MSLKLVQKCVLLFFIITLQSCKKTDYLENSIAKFELSNQNKVLKLKFSENLNELGHKTEPWETNNYKSKGFFSINKNTFQKLDTLTNSRGRNYFSKIDFTKDTLLFIDYGNKELTSINYDLLNEKRIQTAAYHPIFLLNYFYQNKNNIKINSTSKTVIYSLKVGNFATKIYICKENFQVNKITYLKYDELYGDVKTSYNYSNYIQKNAYCYPSLIKIDKINGKVKDEITVLSSEIINKTEVIKKPENYKIIKLEQEKSPKIKVQKYNDYIHFIDLKHTDDKIMVVEFKDFMLVAEAPLNSKNGELIIAETKKIAPLKPIKYFAFGHHHPHYLGGLRAFVHKNATLLTTRISDDYVKYIANAPHTIKPDSLQLEPKKLKTQIIKDSLVLGVNNKMKIYFIGEKSAHTKDYLIYYFPEDKLLFQDDSCWIPIDGPVRKARARERGLYNSIKELNLKVDTIIQSWPVTNYKVKTIIPFSDLEKTMKIE